MFVIGLPLTSKVPIMARENVTNDGKLFIDQLKTMIFFLLGRSDVVTPLLEIKFTKGHSHVKHL